MVFRGEILWVEVVRVNKVILVSDDILEINVHNPPFRNDEVSVGYLVVFGAFSLMCFHQRLESGNYFYQFKQSSHHINSRVTSWIPS